MRRAARASAKLPAGERYTVLRKAEFLLNNATTDAEYDVARREVRALGLEGMIPAVWGKDAR